MVLHVRLCGNSLRSDDRNILLFSYRHFRALENAVAAPTADGILPLLRALDDILMGPSRRQLLPTLRHGRLP